MRESLVLAMLVSPPAGLFALWVCSLIVGPFNNSFGAAAFALPWVFLFGLIPAYVIQTVVVVPLLWGYKRYRWSWLTPSSACAIGFFATALPTAFASLCDSQMRWLDAVVVGAIFGSAGLGAAFAFCRIATRIEPGEM